MKLSQSFSRFTSFLRLASEVVSRSSSRRRGRSSLRSMTCSMARIASAPMSARKESSPYSSSALRYCSSFSSSRYLSGVRPGSVTT